MTRVVLACMLLVVPLVSPLAAPEIAQPRNNVLVLLADDLGVDMLRIYRPDSVSQINDLPFTPSIDRLADDGVLFTNAWSNPVCTPTRSAMQTGRCAFRTGMLHHVPTAPADPDLGMDFEHEFLLPRALDAVLSPLGGGVSCAMVGKWHLSTGLPQDPALLNAPLTAGYSYYAGSLFNIDPPFTYDHWLKTEDGMSFAVNGYATSVQVDDAAAWIGTQVAEDQAWLLVLAFNAPHAPFHKPPGELITHNLTQVDCSISRRPCYVAAIEAMDTEIGRLMDELTLLGVRDETTVIFFGDNGTPGEVTAPPYNPDHAKPSLYEGGIHVPFVVSGYGIADPGRTADGLVNAVDVFGTVMNLFLGSSYESLLHQALPETTVIDAKSLLPILRNRATDVRDYSLAESYVINAHGKAIRNLVRNDDEAPEVSCKLIVVDKMVGDPNLFEEDTRMFFDLMTDPNEELDLMEGEMNQQQLAAYTELCYALQDMCQFDPPIDCAVPYGNGQPTPGRGIDLSRQARLLVEPNPATGRAVVKLRSPLGPGTGHVVLSVYGIDGSLVRRLWDGDAGAIPREIVWDGLAARGDPAPSGAYLLSLGTGGRTLQTGKILLLRGSRHGRYGARS